MSDQIPAQEEKMRMAFSLLGNEVIAFEISSLSSRKNWIVLGSIVFVAMAAAVNQLLPVIQQISAIQ